MVYCTNYCRTRCRVNPKSSFKCFHNGKDNVISNKGGQDLSGVRSEKEYRENVFNIQMLSKNLHDQIFGQSCRTSTASNKIIQTHKNELEKHGVKIKNSLVMPNVHLKIPRLRGKSIVEHFKEIAIKQVEHYEEIMSTLANMEQIPSLPMKWELREGWTQYDPRNFKFQTVDFPEENGLIFDVEVCISHGSAPILATAASNKYWYSWISTQMFRNIEKKNPMGGYLLDELIPLGRSGPKLIVGHNVAYDRARVREQYFLEDTKIRFMDTMSMHICVSGITSYQRAVMKSQKISLDDWSWIRKSSSNSLEEVYKLYCNGEIHSKEPRNAFVNGSINEIKGDLQNLISYCANDVIITQRVLKQLLPLFRTRFPSPITLAGMLELGSAYLPVNSNWLRYLNDSNRAYEGLSLEAKCHLTRSANEACQLLLNEKYKNNLWLWDEDWSVQNLKMKKSDSLKIRKISRNEQSGKIYSDALKFREIQVTAPFFTKFKSLYEMKSLLPARRPLLPGYPAWFRKLCRKHRQQSQYMFDWSPNASEIEIGMQISPKLLSLCWKGFPLHYRKEDGWGFLVSFKHEDQCRCINSTFGNRNNCRINSVIKELLKRRTNFLTIYAARAEENTIVKGNSAISSSRINVNTTLEGSYYFIKLPHKNGNNFRVGSPLSKDFLNKFIDKVLSSESDEESTQRIIKIARMVSYWRNNRDRIVNQMVVWHSFDTTDNTNEKRMQGAICPQVVVCGTLTRRAMEPTWMTASNSQNDRIGSELRAMVQAPKSYKIIGADVDSQELWLASILGDAYSCGIHGGTPLGWMTLSGSKASGTDMHSLTAEAVGISREHAKVLNYARMYGAGQSFAEELLKKFNPSLTVKEAKDKAVKMYAITKGKKTFEIRNQYKSHYKHRRYSGYEAKEISSRCKRLVNEVYYKSFWRGGTESAMFNRIEEIALRDRPVTPFLKACLSRSLEGDNELGTRFLPTRVNWVVQSSAVDFLHLMLVSMRWLMGSHIRFCLSFHDELRYLAKEDVAYKAALAMHITNLLTRSYCSYCLGMDDLPMSVAFFSSVEVDTVLRKDCTVDCKTPSNPHGLQTGYGIPNGESLNIYEAIKKSGVEDLSHWDWIV